MVTGIPDLVIHNDNELHIWDFKTGSVDLKTRETYWFQLMLYAWPYRNKYPKINFRLLYIDEKKAFDKTLEKADIIASVDQNLLKFQDLFKMNEDFCQECEFSKLCHFQTL